MIERVLPLTYIGGDKRRILAISIGSFLIAVGLTVIFAFSTQILIPNQPATAGHWDYAGGRQVWRAGQPSQPEHFEKSFPNLPAGLSLILIGSAVSVVGLFIDKREEYEVQLSKPTANARYVNLILRKCFHKKCRRQYQNTIP